MYIYDESTEKEYFLNPFEKWWHYFLILFAWFVPHKAYQVKNYTKKKDKEANKKPLAESMGMVIVIMGVKLIGEFKDIIFFRVNIMQVVLSTVLLYASSVVAVFVYWKIKMEFSSAKEMKVSKENYIDVKIDLFRKDIWNAVKWKVLITVIAYFAIIVVIYKGGFSIPSLTVFVLYPWGPVTLITGNIAADIKVNFGIDNTLKMVGKI
jgi:Protein of unknown function (DUF443).